MVSVWDHGFLYGDGVFEGIRIRDGRLYRPDLHLERLRDSAHILGIEMPYDDEALLAGTRETARANGLVDAHVRIIVARGVGLPGIDPSRCPRASVSILVYPFPPLLGTAPLRLITSSVARKAPRSLPARVKSLSYGDSVLAKLQANAAGASDAIMLDGGGLVAESTGANIFAVRDGVLRTPPTISALPGITRRTILELAEGHGIGTSVELLDPSDLVVADEAFLTGTGAGIVSIGSVDGRAIAHAPGPITEALAAAYRATWFDPSYTLDLRGD